MNEPKAPDALHVQSLARGLSVIRTFGAERPRQTLAQVAE
ncbi:IclR family transcriptional regulator, partial [Acinetobacter baumannii]|nr:IclR family transcriptional regulator [Acinetobacter baumannii]